MGKLAKTLTATSLIPFNFFNDSKYQIVNTQGIEYRDRIIDIDRHVYLHRIDKKVSAC
jgi:hypothetical protein